MRTFLFGLSGSLYALFNTGVYVDSALQDAGGFGLVPEDYQDLFKTTGGICFTVAVLVINANMFLSLANTYVKKSVRHFTGNEANFLPAPVASVMASIGSVSKSMTSNASIALTLAALIFDCVNDEQKTDSTQAIIKGVSFAFFNVLTLSSTYFINYAIGFNEAKSKGGEAKLNRCNKWFLRLLDRVARPSVHAVISNTPSNIMYVLEGHRFVKFLARFIVGSSEDQYVLPLWLTILSYSVNGLLAMSMELGYNVRYDEEIQKLSKHLYDDSDYHRLSGDEAGKKCCYLWVEESQKQLVKKNNKLIMGTSSIYKSLVMAFSAFMLVYKLSSDKASFDAGTIQPLQAVLAALTGVINMIVCVVALQAFLFEKKKDDTLPLDQPVVEDGQSPRVAAH